MPGLPIVVDVGLAEPQRDSIAVLLGACTQAAADSQCYLVSEAPEGPYRAIAIISWERDDRVRVEVGVRRSGGGEWRTRQLSFQPGDESVERYRSVGFVAGTLARDTPEAASAAEPVESKPPPPAPKVEAPAPATVSPPPSPSQPESTSRVIGFLMPLALVAGALDRGGPRFGGGLRAGLRPRENWFFTAVVEGSFRPRAEEVTLIWIDAGAGVGVRTTATAPLHIEGRAEVLAEIFRAEAQIGGQGASRSRLLGAVRGGADVVLDVGSGVGLAAGVDGTLRFGGTVVRVGGAEVGAAGGADLGGMIGIRVDL